MTLVLVPVSEKGCLNNTGEVFVKYCLGKVLCREAWDLNSLQYIFVVCYLKEDGDN